MRDAIEEISKACQAFEAKESAPPVAGISFSESLYFDFSNYYVCFTSFSSLKVHIYNKLFFLMLLFCSSVMVLRTLQAEITKIYIGRLCSWMQGSTDGISKDETWIPVSILERNKSPYTISYLPLAFRSIMKSAMDQISL